MQDGARGFAPDASAPFAFVLVCEMIAELGGDGCDECIQTRLAILRIPRSGSDWPRALARGVCDERRGCQVLDDRHRLAKIDTKKTIARQPPIAGGQLGDPFIARQQARDRRRAFLPAAQLLSPA